MALATGDIVRITCKMSQDGKDVQNVYHMKAAVSAAVTYEDFLDELAQDFDDMYNLVDTRFADVLTFDTIEMYNITKDEYIGETAWPVLTVGSSLSDELPVQSSPCVLFPSDKLRSQGRKFLPPLTIGSLDDHGTIVASVLAEIAAYAAEALTAKVGTDWAGVLGNWNPDLGRFAEWVSAVVLPEFKTQRRRYTGTGS